MTKDNFCKQPALPSLINFTLDFYSVPANPAVTPCSTEASLRQRSLQDFSTAEFSYISKQAARNLRPRAEAQLDLKEIQIFKDSAENQ